MIEAAAARYFPLKAASFSHKQVRDSASLASRIRFPTGNWIRFSE